MIKPGTLCIIVPPCIPESEGLIVTVLGPLTDLGVDRKYRMQYPTTGRNGDGRKWYAAPAALRPLNDPDSAPADPAYTKRKETA